MAKPTIKMFEDPKFQGLQRDKQTTVLTNYFDRELADDKFTALPETKRAGIRTNFINAQIGERAPVREEIKTPPELDLAALQPQAEPASSTAVAGVSPPGPAQPQEQQMISAAEEGYLETIGTELVGGLAEAAAGAFTAVGSIPDAWRRAMTPRKDLQGKPGAYTPSKAEGPIEVGAKKMQDYFLEKAEEYTTTQEYAGKNLWDNPELIIDPKFMVAGTARMVPAMAAAMVPGMAALKYGTTAAAIVGGASGGLMEGVNTYRTTLERGGDRDEAFKNMIEMTIGSGLLNSLGLGKIFGKAKGKKLIKGVADSLVEGITEYLEEPTEALILGMEKEEFIQKMKDGLAVIGPAMIMGGGGSAVSQYVQRGQEIKAVALEDEAEKTDDPAIRTQAEQERELAEQLKEELPAVDEARQPFTAQPAPEEVAIVDQLRQNMRQLSKDEFVGLRQANAAELAKDPGNDKLQHLEFAFQAEEARLAALPKTKLGRIMAAVGEPQAPPQAEIGAALPEAAKPVEAADATIAPDVTTGTPEGVIVPEPAAGAEEMIETGKVSALASEQARKAEELAEPTETEKKLAKAMEEEAQITEGTRQFIDNKVAELGSVEAVDAEYAADRAVDQYAREHAREVFKAEEVDEKAQAAVAAEPEVVAEEKGEEKVEAVEGKLVAKPASDYGFKGLAAKRWTVDGSLLGDTPKEAVEVYKKEQARLKEVRAEKKQRDAILPKLKSGEYTADDIKKITRFGNKAVITGEAEGTLRDLGLKSTEARKVIKKSFDVDTTSGGAILYDLAEVVETARRMGYLPETKPAAAPVTAEPVTEAAEVKQPWQQTKAEFELEHGKPTGKSTVTGGFTPHKEAVATAINRGDKVHAEVIADYPDLAAKYGEKKPVLDAVAIQKKKNSIREGEMILESGKDVIGKKMSKDALAVVSRQVEKDKRKLAELETERGTKRPIRNSQVHAALLEAFARGKSAVLATYTKAVKLSKPEHIRVNKAGEFQVVRGRNWDTLLDSQVEQLAKQIGLKVSEKPAAPVEAAPVQREAGPVLPDVQKFPVQRIAVEDIKVSPGEFQFKKDIDELGVQEPLKGKFDEFASGNLLLWQAKDGTLFVVNGHHRLAKARESGIYYLNAQIVDEADGISRIEAKVLGAETNIREGRGTIYDHAEYFRNIPKEQAAQRRDRGLEGKGHKLASLAGDNVYSAFQNRAITPEQALAIVDSAGKNEESQAVGLRVIQRAREDGKKLDPDDVSNLVRANAFARQNAQELKTAQQADLFGGGFDAAIELSEQLSKIASQHQKSLKEKILALRIVKKSKRLSELKKVGLEFKSIDDALSALRGYEHEAERWKHWDTDKKLRQQIIEELNSTTGQQQGLSFATRAVTRTPEFKKWFKGSKVVDEKGEPLVVYHGTATPGITKFKSKWDEFYFTEKRRVAEEFGYNIMPVYLSLQNPYVVETESGEGAMEAAEYAKKRGYDGVIAKGVSEGAYLPKHMQIIAFRPNQIKLVTNLRPTADPDIRFATRPADAISQAADAVEEPGGATIEQVKFWVRDYIGGFNTETVILKSIEELPEPIRSSAILEAKRENLVIGLYDSEFTHKAYLIADGLQNKAEAVKILFHEKVGHEGIENLLGEEGFAGFLTDLQNDKHIGALIKTMADERGIKELQATKEWFADEAQGVNFDNIKDPNIIQRLVFYVKKWLRKTFKKMKTPFSNAEIRDLIRQSYRYATEAKQAKAQAKAKPKGQAASVELTPLMKSEKAHAEWYSKMETVISNKLPGSGTAASYRQMIESWAKKGEFKAEELQWSGLLDDPTSPLVAGKGKITKQKIVDWLAENNVRVEEVVRGDIDIYNMVEPWWNDEGGANEETPYAELTAQERQAANDRYRNEVGQYEAGATKFSAYQLPGGTNYREVLITLPVKRLAHNYVVERKQDGAYFVMNKTTGESYPNLFESAEQAARWAEKQTADPSGKPVKRGEDVFTTSHFDEPNVLAHLRLNDRTDAEGNRVLFVEEVQSDWAAKLRESLPLRSISKPKSVRVLANDFFGGELPSTVSLNQVDGGVLSLTKNNQVADAIISLLPVDMVNDLGGKKIAAKNLAQNPSMIFKSLPADTRSAGFVRILGAARSVFAGVRTKLLGFKTGRDIDLLPTLKASDLTTREVISTLSPASLYHVGLTDKAVRGDVTLTGTEEAAALGDRTQINRERLPATDAEFLHTTLSAGLGAVPAGSESADFGAEGLTASVAEALDWHNGLLVKLGTSQPTVYKPSDTMSMPFAKTYPLLAMKKAIRMAAEGGYDSIAWTTGEQQAARYDLSKQVDKVMLATRTDGSRYLYAYKDGNAVITEQIYKDEDVEKYIGKDPARKLLDAEKVDDRIGNPYQTISGLDLKVGGEGMKAFYDKMLPAAVNKYVKKWGSRVGETKIEAEKFGGEFSAIQSMSGPGYNVRIEGQGSRQPYLLRDENDNVMRFNTSQEAERYAETAITPEERPTVHSLNITPEMRQAALMGQPLFKSRKQVERVAKRNNIATNIGNHSFSSSEFGWIAPDGTVYTPSHGEENHTDFLLTLIEDGALSDMRDQKEFSDMWDYFDKDGAPDSLNPIGLTQGWLRFNLQDDRLFISAKQSPALVPTLKAVADGVTAQRSIRSLIIDYYNEHGGESAWEGHPEIFIKYGFDKPSKAQQFRSGQELGGISFATRPNDKMKALMVLYGKGTEQKYRLSRTIPEIPEELGRDKFARIVTDKLKRLQVAQRHVSGKPEERHPLREYGDIQQEQNARLAAELYPGRVSYKLDKLDDYLMKDRYSFLGRLVKDGFDISQLGEYMYAKHTAERRDKIYSDLITEMEEKLETLTDEELANAKREIEYLKEDQGDRDHPFGSGLTLNQADNVLERYENTNIDEYAQEFRENVIMPTLNRMHDYGEITDEQYEIYKDQYDFYVPLKGKAGASTFPMTGKGFSVKGTTVKRAKGRESLADNPFVQAIIDFEQAVTREEKNRVGLRFLKLVEANPSAMWDSQVVANPSTVNEDGEIVFRDPATDLPKEIFHVKEAGKTVEITIRDPLLAKTMKNIGVENINEFFGPTLEGFNSFMRSMITTFSPVFPIFNMIRDTPTGTYHITADHGAKLALKTLKRMPAAMNAVRQNVRSESTKKLAGRYEELKATGGKMGWFENKPLDKKIDQLVRRAKRFKGRNWITNGGKAVGDLIQAWNEITESGIRLAVYDVLIEDGATKEDAANYAKNVTVNFNRKGEIGRTLNGLFLFSNASIQGIARNMRTLGVPGKPRNRREVRAQALWGLIVMVGFLRDMGNRAIDEDDYEDIPEHIRDMNAIYHLGEGRTVSVPLPYGLNVPWVLGTLLSELMHTEQPDMVALAGRMAGAVVDAASPVGGGPIEQVLMPTIADLPIQLATNKKFYGAPIAPEQPAYAPKKPRHELYFRGVRPQTKMLTDWLAKRTETERHPYGALSVSPEHIDHTIDFLGGGVGKFAGNVVATGISLLTDKDVETRRIPIVRRLYHAPYEGSSKQIAYQMLDGSKTTQYSPGEVLRFDRSLDKAVKDKSMTQDKADELSDDFGFNQADLKTETAGLRSRKDLLQAWEDHYALPKPERQGDRLKAMEKAVEDYNKRIKKTGERPISNTLLRNAIRRGENALLKGEVK